MSLAVSEVGENAFDFSAKFLSKNFWMLHLKTSSEFGSFTHLFSCNFCFLYASVVVF